MDNQQLESNRIGVTGYEEKYSVTRTGEVYNRLRNKRLKLKVTRFGYKEAALSNQRGGKRDVKYIGVHRLVAKAFISNPGKLDLI